MKGSSFCRMVARDAAAETHPESPTGPPGRSFGAGGHGGSDNRRVARAPRPARPPQRTTVTVHPAWRTTRAVFMPIR